MSQRYIIVTGEANFQFNTMLGNLCEEVNAWIEQGYTPLGPPQFIYDSTATYMRISQAMFKGDF